MPSFGKYIFSAGKYAPSSFGEGYISPSFKVKGKYLSESIWFEHI